MSQLELCVAMDTDRFLLPCALPAATEAELKREWLESAAVLPVLHYIGRSIEAEGKHAMIPPGAFSATQVRLVNQLKPRKYILWRGTAILFFADTHLRVDLLGDRASISVVARGQPDASRAVMHAAIDVVLSVLCSVFELKLRFVGGCPACLLKAHDPTCACFFTLSERLNSKITLRKLFEHFKVYRVEDEGYQLASSADVSFVLVSSSPFCRSKSVNIEADDILNGRL